ncbi:MAG TPA: PKD domain-containing protein, partial [Chitinophagales bacterium]|nr:PKD domain-containing protein [Chitinophagales bacterium]
YFYGNQASGHLYSRSGLEGQPPNFTPKKALTSFQAFVHLLGNKYFLDTLREDSNAWIYLFGDSSGNPTHIAAWRPIKGDDNNTIQVNLVTTLKPDTAWIISGLNSTGEPAPLPNYASGVMSLMVSSAPLIIKVSPTFTNNYVWTGNISTEWNNPLNWNTYDIPDAASIVTLPAGRPHYPSNYSGNIEVNMLVLNAGGEMTLVPGSDLVVHNSLVINGGILRVTGTGGHTPDIHIGGNFTMNSGSFIAGTGKVIFDGSFPQTISGTVAFCNLMIDNHSTVAIQNPVTIAGVASVMTGSTLITNGKLTIESGGSLMHGQDTPNGQQGSVIGNVTVKRRGSTNPQIYNYWSAPVEGANVSSLVTTPYYYDPSRATDMTETGLRQGWVQASGVMQPGVGYISKGAGTVSFNGNPGSAPAANPYLATVKKNAGTGNDVTWNLVGNPFPSALDASKFIDMNGPAGAGFITGALYFWDDDGTGGSGWNAVQDYAVWNGAGLVAGPNSGTIFNGNIASCQSFFVEKISDGTSHLVFNNSMRTTANNAFFLTIPTDRLWLSIINPNSNYNETLLAFLNEASDTLDLLYDAKKLPGNAGISFYSQMNGGNYAIQSFALLRGDKIIPLGFKTGKAGTHVISLKRIEGLDESVAVVLEDRTSGIFTPLRMTPSYSFYSAIGEYNSRFFLHIGKGIEISVTPQECDGSQGNISIQHDGNWHWDFVLTDENGVVIQSVSGLHGRIDVDVSAGKYTLALTDDYGYQLSKMIEVPAKQPVQADFSYYSYRRKFEPGLEIFFDDNSAGALYNEWNFGDGSVLQNDFSPVHIFNYPGDYEVTLRTWNNDCEGEYSSVVIINPASASSKTTGVKDDVSRDEMLIYASREAIFVYFNFKENVKAAFYLYDVTGSLMLSAEMMTEGMQKVSIPQLPEAIYFAKVVTPAKTFSSRVLPGFE